MPVAYSRAMAAVIVGALAVLASCTPSHGPAASGKRPVPGGTAGRSSGGPAPQPGPGAGTAAAALRCSDAIDQVASPAGYAVVLGQVALQLAGVMQASPSGTGDPATRLFAKSALLVRSGARFDLTVPPAWRHRLAIGWGSPAAISVSLSVAGCTASPAGQWIVFPGGFWVSQPACAPLVITGPAGSGLVHVPVGRRCPPGQLSR